MKKQLFLVLLSAALLGAYSQALAKDVTLKWDGNPEPNVSGYKVYYKANSATGAFDGADAAQGKSPVDVKNVTSMTLNGLDAGKNYYFQVTAYDASGNESGFSNMVQAYEAVAPTVSITAPAAGTSVNGTVAVTANAADNVKVAKVEFFVNNALASTAVSAPFGFSWNASSYSDGTYTISAKAYDEAGNVGTANVTVAVAKTGTVPGPVVAGKGDANGDGKIDIQDAVLALRAVVDPKLQTAALKTAADVFPLDSSGKPAGDGRINMNDAQLILQRAVGLVSW